MGICEKVILPKVEDVISKLKVKKVRMIELGNQHFNDGRIAKEYYTNKGIDHVSIDINGLDGALPLDLTKEISVKPANIVTNHGTTEHIKDQKACFDNIDKLCKKGGYMIHQVPMVGTWKHHANCFHRYTLDSFLEISKEYGYTIVENRELNEGIYTGSKNMIWCILKKG